MNKYIYLAYLSLSFSSFVVGMEQSKPKSAPKNPASLAQLAKAVVLRELQPNQYQDLELEHIRVLLNDISITDRSVFKIISTYKTESDFSVEDLDKLKHIAADPILCKQVLHHVDKHMGKEMLACLANSAACHGYLETLKYCLTEYTKKFGYDNPISGLRFDATKGCLVQDTTKINGFVYFFGKTPMHYARKNQQNDIITYLKSPEVVTTKIKYAM